MSGTKRAQHDDVSVEWRRLYSTQEEHGMFVARDFAKRTYAKYRECLRLTGRNGKKLHHASLPQYRSGFVVSCMVFRDYLRKTRWMEPKTQKLRPGYLADIP